MGSRQRPGEAEFESKDRALSVLAEYLQLFPAEFGGRQLPDLSRAGPRRYRSGDGRWQIQRARGDRVGWELIPLAADARDLQARFVSLTAVFPTLAGARNALAAYGA